MQKRLEDKELSLIEYRKQSVPVENVQSGFCDSYR
jgi:hypothetical protein